MFKRFGLLIVAILFTLPAFAGFQEDVARDLGEKTATLVAPAGSEWLIDLDAASGVQAGDLFAVITKGSPVVHPVTKKVIGSIDETRALLRVTKVKSGYSYAAVVKADGDLRAGDEARRFTGLPAVFWDYAGDGEGIFAQLQGALPGLHWQSYAAAQASRPDQPRPVPGMEPGLVFVFNAQGLGVKDQTFQPLRFYRPDQMGRGPAPAAAGSAPVAGAYAATAPSAGGIVSGEARGTMPGSASPGWLPTIFGGGGSTQPGPGGVLAGSGGARGGLIVSQMDSKEGIWYGPRMAGSPVGVEVGDLDGDGKNEVAMGFKDRLVVARVVAGKFEPVADYSFERAGNALSFSGLDLDGNGRMEFYITLAQVNSISSIGLELQGGKLQQVIKPVPYFLRKVSLDGSGYALLSQDLNPDTKNTTHDFAGAVFQVTRSGDRLERSAPVDVPNGVTLYGFQPFVQEGQRLIARINSNDRLEVLNSAGALLWESSDNFGGSEVSFERPDGMAQGNMTRYAFISPRLAPGPEGTLLVPVNEGNRTFSAFQTFNASHLKAVAYDGYSMVERWRTKPQGGYLGDFCMADADNDGAPEIVMLVMFSHGNWIKTDSGNTALLIYEMQ